MVRNIVRKLKRESEEILSNMEEYKFKQKIVRDR